MLKCKVNNYNLLSIYVDYSVIFVLNFGFGLRERWGLKTFLFCCCCLSYIFYLSGMVCANVYPWGKPIFVTLVRGSYERTMKLLFI